MPYIEKLQGNVKHIGKQIEYTENKTETGEDKDEIDLLKEQLEMAVKNEKYEDAAVLRDKINKLKEDK